MLPSLFKINNMQQPDIEAQKELNSIIENLPDYVRIGKKRYRVKWLHPVTVRKINQIVLEDGNDHNASHKTAACIALNNVFKLKLLYPLLWRWFYYIKQYTEDDFTEILALGKKKIPLQAYYANTILMTDMKDTMMAMTKEEASSFRQELITAQHGSSRKNTDG